MITNPQHALTFGPLNLIGTPSELATDGYRFEALGDDADWGNPVPIEQKINSWLQDGSLVALLGYDNRDMFIRVRVKGTDGNKLALGEQALMLQMGKRNTLVWTPPDGVAEACVFSVVTSHLEHVFDDLEDLHLERVYGLRITAEPFVRSQDPVSVTQAAPPGGGVTVTTVDDCTSTTNWTGTPNAPATVGGTIYEQPNVQRGESVTSSLKRSGLSVSMASTPYLRIDWDPLGTAGITITSRVVKANNIVLDEVASNGTVHWYDASAIATLNTVEVIVTGQYAGPNGITTWTWRISDISQTNGLVDPGATNRQLARTLPVTGSARTQGSLLIEDTTNALGTVLAYTCPAVDGMAQPALRPFQTSGPAATPDSSTISGKTTDMLTFNAFDVPETALVPGGHLLIARVKHAAAGARTITWTASSLQGSTYLPDYQTGTFTATLAANTWTFLTLASLNLPPRKTGASGKIRIDLSGPSGLLLDEAWLFNIEVGQLTWVDCGSASPSPGGAANRLWLDAPTIDNPSPSVWLGTTADRSDSFHAGSEMKSFGEHEFTPPTMNVFTVTSNSTASSVTLRHHPRWHTHPAAA